MIFFFCGDSCMPIPSGNKYLALWSKCGQVWPSIVPKVSSFENKKHMSIFVSKYFHSMFFLEYIGELRIFCTKREGTNQIQTYFLRGGGTQTSTQTYIAEKRKDDHLLDCFHNLILIRYYNYILIRKNIGQSQNSNIIKRQWCPVCYWM